MTGDAAIAVSAFPGTAPMPSESMLATLRQSLEHSPAIAWVKDLNGRYLVVNHRYRVALGASEERLRGHSDSELPPRETIDGPRMRYADDGVREPLELEYTIPAFEGRPALLALRFSLREADGQPIGLCGVAAPIPDAHLARDEAARVMAIFRGAETEPTIARPDALLDATDDDQRAEPAAFEPPDVPPPEASLAEGPRDDLALARTWAEHAFNLQQELEQTHARARDAERELEDLRAELGAVRSTAQAARADAQAARAEIESFLDGVLTHDRERADELARDVAAVRSRLARTDSDAPTLAPGDPFAD